MRCLQVGAGEWLFVGAWSFTAMREFPLGGIKVVHGGPGQPPGGPGPGVRAPVGQSAGGS